MSAQCSWYKEKKLNGNSICLPLFVNTNKLVKQVQPDSWQSNSLKLSWSHDCQNIPLLGPGVLAYWNYSTLKSC